MKATTEKAIDAYEMFRDKLPDHPLTLEDWVLAEKDLVKSLEDDNLPK